MTLVTGSGSRYMVDRFAGSTDRPELRMAADAVRTCSFKCTSGMAAVARDRGMSAIEVEAGAEVVECFLGG